MAITLILLADNISTVQTANTTLPTEMEGSLLKHESSQQSLDDGQGMVISQSKQMSNASQTMDMKRFVYVC